MPRSGIFSQIALELLHVIASHIVSPIDNAAANTLQFIGITAVDYAQIKKWIFFHFEI